MIDAFLLNELIVVTKFDDAGAFKDGDGVCFADGGEAMGDDDGGFALHELFEGLLDELFCLGVDCAGGYEFFYYKLQITKKIRINLLF